MKAVKHVVYEYNGQTGVLKYYTEDTVPSELHDIRARVDVAPYKEEGPEKVKTQFIKGCGRVESNNSITYYYPVKVD